MKMITPKRGCPRRRKKLQVSSFTKVDFDYRSKDGLAVCGGCGGNLGEIGRGYRVEFDEERAYIYLCGPCWRRLDFATSAKARVIR